jgi:hypothetical protein
MKHTSLKPAMLTLVWALVVAVFFRFWGVTLRAPGLMLWALVCVLLYLGTAALVYRRDIRSLRKKVWIPLAFWVAIILLVLVVHTAFPIAPLAGQEVPTSLVVGAMDVVVPVWIVGRSMGLIWTSVGMRVAVIAIGTVVLFVLMFTYMMAMPGTSFSGSVPPLSSEEQAIRDRLETEVQTLAMEIGDRHEGRYEALERAASFVEGQFKAAGFEPAVQWYEYAGHRFRNIEVEIAGASQPAEIVVVGGHYDTVPFSPGANDNASGTVAVLELARLLRNERFSRTIRFVAFVNEEPPYFTTRWMGSRQYASRSKDRGENIVAMISMETIGYFKTEPGSQHYPPLFSLFYPDRGDFIGFVGNLASRSLVRRCIRVFRETTELPSEGVAAVEQIPGITWSDHSAFWAHGYKAIMITDTAPFRFPHYHLPTDTPDKLDFDRMTRVITGTSEVLRDLAGPVMD